MPRLFPSVEQTEERMGHFVTACTRERLRRPPCEVPPSRHQRHRELHMGRLLGSGRSSHRWILLFFPNLGQNPDKYAGISPHPFPGQKRTPALLDQMGGLLAAAGKSDNLTYLQKHGVSSVWAPMLSAWSRGDCDTFSRQTPMRFSQSQSKPRRLKMDNKEPRCLLCSFLPPIERLEETLRMRSGGPKVRLQVSK